MTPTPVHECRKIEVACGIDRMRLLYLYLYYLIIKDFQYFLVTSARRQIVRFDT